MQSKRQEQADCLTELCDLTLNLCLSFRSTFLAISPKWCDIKSRIEVRTKAWVLGRKVSGCRQTGANIFQVANLLALCIIQTFSCLNCQGPKEV